MEDSDAASSSPSDVSIAAFWSWFAGHESRWRLVDDATSPFCDEVLDRLRQLDSRLRFEVCLNCEPREFVLSAEGCTTLFPVVDAIVAAAPNMKGWDFIPLKPRMGFSFVTTYQGCEYDPRTMGVDASYLETLVDALVRHVDLKYGIGYERLFALRPGFVRVRHGHWAGV